MWQGSRSWLTRIVTNRSNAGTVYAEICRLATLNLDRNEQAWPSQRSALSGLYQPEWTHTSWSTTPPQ